MSMKVKEGDYVSADRDWRSLISNELNGAKQWEDDWGFLTSGNALINDSIEDKIKKLEEVTPT